MTERSASSLMLTVAAAMVLMGAAIAMPGPAAADLGPQIAQSSQNVDQSNQNSQQFSEEKLDAFATTAVQISEIAKSWGPKIREAKEAGNTQKAQQLSQQANTEMQQTIQNADGISMSEYQTITQEARQDKQLYQKIIGKMQETQ